MKILIGVLKEDVVEFVERLCRIRSNDLLLYCLFCKTKTMPDVSQCDIKSTSKAFIKSDAFSIKDGMIWGSGISNPKIVCEYM